MLCCSCGMYFSAAASSENDQGSMNLASKTASVASTRPSNVAAIQRRAGCRIWRWTSVRTWPVLASYQRRFSPFFPPKAEEGHLVIAHNDPGVRAANKVAALTIIELEPTFRHENPPV